MKSSNLFLFAILLATLHLMAAASVNEAGKNEKGDVMKKPAKMNEAKKAGSPKLRGKDEEERLKAENEKVKKLLAKHRCETKSKWEKLAEEQKNDPELQAVLANLEEARKRNPYETKTREDTKSIPEINEHNADELYQGDIMLTLDQAIEMFGDLDNCTVPSCCTF